MPVLGGGLLTGLASGRASEKAGVDCLEVVCRRVAGVALRIVSAEAGSNPGISHWRDDEFP